MALIARMIIASSSVATGAFAQDVTPATWSQPGAAVTHDDRVAFETAPACR